MKIAVINGSPKGKYSITLQTVRYLERKYPEHEFMVLHAGQRIKALEKDFTEAKKLLDACDAVLFSYPVYTFLAPSQLHRFIELVKEHEIDLKGKYATQISTSKHFYDITAHKYIEENALDLKMKYIRGLSADMEDLLSEQGREDAEKFFERFLWAVKEDIYTVRTEEPSEYKMVRATVPGEAVNTKAEKDIVIITDNTDETSNLQTMIARFRQVFPYQTGIVNISEYPLMGGCLGCFRCAVSEKCVYKDEFDSFLRENIQKADAIVYAFTISDHSMGSRFKMYDDRNFCNGHRTVTFALETKHTTPQNFWGVGGMKIFRDLIYQMRGMMRADHKFYKKQGIYDFPQKKRLTSMKMYLVGALLSNEKILSKMGNKMNEGMIAPYEKMFAKMDKEQK